jgi:hypothetical protein
MLRSKFVTDLLDGLLLGWIVGWSGAIVFVVVWVGILGRPLMGL